ncbi:MAG TPA: hypothetical protein VF069_06815 [Streptosporangiaceae bacterium]
MDPFGTAGIRERVLAGWVASPARFREDANTEEDFALGGYRDRVVVELAQNSADAAVRAGRPGRLLLSLRGGVLTAANAGAPLDAAGVQALSTLRASAKLAAPADAGSPAREAAEATEAVEAAGRALVGRFGVGFAAVVAVTDEPAIASRAVGGVAGVTWSAARSRELVSESPELAAELARRAGHVPVLRLPFAVTAPAAVIMQWFPPAASDDGGAGVAGSGVAGFDTVVRLPLRDAAAVELVRRLLDEVGPALMLALPALDRIDIDVDGRVRTVTAAHGPGTTTINGAAWRTVEAHGDLPPGLLADRPTEERARPFWQLRWAIPEAAAGLPGDVPAVVHAPTPSAEPLGLPALLIASFPLAPDRRHVADGPLTAFLIERAAEEYVKLLRALPATPRLLDLVPGPVAAGALDARLRRSISARLPDVPLLPAVEDGGLRQRGRDAVALDAPPVLLELLAGVLPGLLPGGWPVRHPALVALGVRRMELAEVVDELAALDRDPDWWHGLYAALAGGGADPDALGALPVPLADGRLVRGPRGLLIADDGLDPAELGVLGLRFVHPRAAHPLLVRLGAARAGPRAVLGDPAVRAAVARSYDVDDQEEAGEIAAAVLSLVAAARAEPGELAWLAELALPAADGERYPAGELLLPDAPLRDVVAADAPFGVVAQELVDRYGPGPLEAAGVLRTFAVLRERDVPLADPGLDLDGEEDWVDDVLAGLPPHDLPPTVPELAAVRDLELVDRWDRALALLAEPPLRAAVVEPARVLLGDGRAVPVPSYTAWWLRRHPVLGGRRPDGLRAPGADPILAELYEAAPAGPDPELLRALGVRTSLAEVIADPDDLLARLADPARTVSRDRLRTIWTALAEAAARYEERPGSSGAHGTAGGWPAPAPPDRVRAVVDGSVEVVPAEDALVLDHPALLPLLAGQPLVIVPYELAAALADLLDLPRASEEIVAGVESAGEPVPVPEVVARILPGAPSRYLAHDPLMVGGRPVPWWCAEDGAVHVGRDRVGGLARGLAWAAGRWRDRLLVEAALRAPETVADLLAEADLDR